MVARPINDMVERPIGGTTINELANMVLDLKFAQVRRDEGRNLLNRWTDLPHRCIWCKSLNHQ